MITRVKEAEDKFDLGFNCAQAVFSSYSEIFGVDESIALKIAGGFGGGMGKLQNKCGAVTGAFMLISLKIGFAKFDDLESKEKTTELIKKFNERFKEKFGTTICYKLLNCDLNTEEGLKYFEDKNMHETNCKAYVSEAAKIIEDIIL